MKPISVIIVDDHPIFRQGIFDSFSSKKDIVVVAQAENGEDGLEYIRSYHPEVAILDINMPGINGLQVVRQVKLEKLATRIILLTAYADATQKLQGFLQGAYAFCTKDIQPDLLAQVIRWVAAGKYWVDSRVLEPEMMLGFLAGQAVEPISSIAETATLPIPLSTREMEILTCISKGMSNKEIAKNLGISNQTVKNHVTAVLHKLGVNDRTQAALYALHAGWVHM